MSNVVNNTPSKWKRVCNNDVKSSVSPTNHPPTTVNGNSTFHFKWSGDDSEMTVVVIPSELKCGQPKKKAKDNTTQITKNLPIVEHIAETVVKLEESEEFPNISNKGLSDELVCSICKNLLETKQLLGKHVEVHHGTSGCRTFDQLFEKLHELSGHAASYMDEKPYKCKYTKEGFVRPCTNSFRDKLYHTLTEPHLFCKECVLGFNSSSALETHKTTHSRFECNYCGQSFCSQSYLGIHKRTHIYGEKPYKCKVCKRSFTQASTLKTHEIIHSGLKPYRCKDCGKCFSDKKNLKIHNLIHTGVKPFKCETCGKCFRRLNNLKVHQKVHNGKTPYKCNKCRKRFGTLSAFEEHERIHQEEVNFCNDCGDYEYWKRNADKPHSCNPVKPNQEKDGKKLSGSPTSVKTPKKFYAAKKGFECEDCGKCFSKKRTLNKHKSVHII